MNGTRRRHAAIKSAARVLVQISKAKPTAITIVPPGKGVSHERLPISSKMTAITDRNARNLLCPFFEPQRHPTEKTKY